MAQIEKTRINRLVGLCKLWSAIKFFHPYLAYCENIDWDAALIDAIPKINAANNVDEYAAAIQSMLRALGDPVTRIIKQEPPETTSSLREHQPSHALTNDNILVININYYQDLADFYGVEEKMRTIKEKIPAASGVLFDLRAKTPLSQERGLLSMAFLSSDIATVLSATQFTTPGERTRMHHGFVPQKGSTSGEYASAFKVFDGRRILPAHNAKDIPIVFLINEWSELPPEALALQMAGKAGIIAEGESNDASLVKTQKFLLGDEVIAEVRLSELVYGDGTGGFLPNISIPVSQVMGIEDQALSLALKLLHDFKLQKINREQLPARAVPLSEKSYSDMDYPSLEYRLLSVFRIWAVINYFFPYKELIEEDWDEVLMEFITRMEQANSALEYHLSVAEMITHIHDSHGFVDSPLLKEHFGSSWPPFRLQMLENVPVVTTILDEMVAKTAGLNYGDVILKIDGEDAMNRIADRAKYRAASTPQRLLYRAAFASLSGQEDTLIILTVRDRDNHIKEVKMSRRAEFGNLNLGERNGEVIKLLSDEVGYADLDRLEYSMVDEMFEKFKGTKAIIFDMRGYPKGTAWAIAPRLTDKNNVRAALFQCPILMAPNGANNDTESQPSMNIFMQYIPATEKWRYKGKTVMLIDERTQSQAEHTGLFFEAANDTKFVGSHTAGANGDVTNFFVPGGINIWFTGQSVKHVDGRQLQRIGLKPDIEVKPTIKGIQNGKDEVLERALSYIQSEIEKTLPKK